MAIKVMLKGAFDLYYKNRCKEIYDKYKRGMERNSLLYPIDKEITVIELLEDINIPPSIVSLVLINKTRYSVDKNLLDVLLKDGDSIEVFPKIVGG